MFSFKNKITSWYYKYTDNLLANKLKRQIACNKELTPGHKYAMNINIFITIPLLILIFFGIMFFNFFKSIHNHYLMQYFFIGLFFYCVSMLVILLFLFVIESVRKKHFKDLLLILGSLVIFTLYRFFLRSLVDKFIDKSFSDSSSAIYYAILLVSILIIFIVGISLNNKNRY